MRQARAALLAAATQNCFAGAVGHAFHKTVLAGAVTFFGLVRSFGHSIFHFIVPGRQLQGISKEARALVQALCFAVNFGEIDNI